MYTFEELMVLEVYRNSLETWLMALIMFTALLLGLMLARFILSNRIEAFFGKTDASIGHFAAELIRKTRLILFMAIALYSCTQPLTLPGWVDGLMSKLPFMAFLFQCALWANMILAFVINRYVDSRKTEDEQRVSKTMVAPFKFFLSVGIYALLFLLALDNLGVNITALVAGLGVGGIAVALAVQNIVGDLFAAVSIVIDKPFVIGDFIIVNDYRGVVEHIGLKTTRLRSLGGEELVFGNEDLLKSRISNYQSMKRRRINFSFGVTYETPAAKLEKIAGYVKEIIENEELATFDRAHFARYADFSLDYDVVYYVEAPEFNIYMDVQQAVNLAMYRKFEEEGIDFAYPTRTLYVAPKEGTSLPPAFQEGLPITSVAEGKGPRPKKA